MNENWDRFPSNINEMTGSIERKPFDFHYSRFEVWQGGRCIASGDSEGVVSARLHGRSLVVEVPNPAVRDHIAPRFQFGEISTNGDRVMWSKDILNQGHPVEHNNPDISSLFYQGGRLAKVTFTIHDPNTLVEFYGNGEPSAASAPQQQEFDSEWDQIKWSAQRILSQQKESYSVPEMVTLLRFQFFNTNELFEKSVMIRALRMAPMGEINDQLMKMCNSYFNNLRLIPDIFSWGNRDKEVARMEEIKRDVQNRLREDRT